MVGHCLVVVSCYSGGGDVLGAVSSLMATGVWELHYLCGRSVGGEDHANFSLVMLVLFALDIMVTNVHCGLG
jgi:hypothetical protein